MKTTTRKPARKTVHFTFNRYGYIIRLATRKKFSTYTMHDLRHTLRRHFGEIVGTAFTVTTFPRKGALALHNNISYGFRFDICTSGLLALLGQPWNAALPQAIYVTKV